MIDTETGKQNLSVLNEKIESIAKAFDINNLNEELTELNAEMSSDGFWNDIKRSAQVNQRIKLIEKRIKTIHDLRASSEDILAMLNLLDEEMDEDISNECENELENLKEKIDLIELETLMRGEYDNCDAILSLHAGAGGTEAQDWASMLYRMYVRYCERNGFTVKVLDLQDGEEAGIKSVTFQVSGDYAYGFLRSEKGVHRLVRISPFDSNAKRHTSFTSLDVSPMIDDDEFELNMEDVRIDTYRSSGAGGQHVNKTDSAVRMTHIPSGIVVQCQNERSQIQNREVCLKMLKSRLIELQEREKEERMANIKGEMKKIEWGSQIRSYVFQPYSMVKDHRTGCETSNIGDVMDGKIDEFINTYLRQQ